MCHKHHFSGTVTVDGIIELPESWFGKIKPETINVQLTPLDTFQELFVKEIPYGRKVVVRNNSGGVIKAHFDVIAESIEDV